MTSIGLDHTDILGSTYLDIAKDKGAIIKPNVPVIYAVKNEEALKYIRDLAENQNAKPIELDREIIIVSEDDEFTYRYKDYELETIILDMIVIIKRKCFISYYSFNRVERRKYY